MPRPRSPKAVACRSRCARARSRTSSATATSRSAWRSTSASGAATRARPISRWTAEDPHAGLPEANDLATPAQAARELDLFHPWDIDVAGATELAKRCEDAAFATDRRITNSEGAGVSAQQSHFWTGNTRGFRGGYASSRHSLSVAPIAGKGGSMQRDHWYTSMRDAADLAEPEAVGRYAAERALSRLKSRKVATCEVPILFESTLAAGLLGAFVQGVSGGALYRKASFLQDSLGTEVFPPDVDILEFPHEPKGKGSAPFDDEGVLTKARDVVSGGVVQGYFLSSYSARKLGMKTTGHAGGSQNLRLTHRLLARRGRLLCRERPHRPPGRGGHDRRPPAQHAQGHPGRRRGRLQLRREDDRLGAAVADEGRRLLSDRHAVPGPRRRRARGFFISIAPPPPC
jgi:PmbA protein